MRIGVQPFRILFWRYCFTLAFLFFIGISTTHAQKRNLSRLSLEEFIRQVRNYHPISKIAGLKVGQANAEVLSARGNFDPSIEVKTLRKVYKGTDYYQTAQSELSIPLPAGELKTGIENNVGTYLNPEISQGQSSYLGIEMPLLKGLLLDKRRSSLRQAAFYKSQSEEERRSVLNNLFLEAYSSYIQWAANDQIYKIYDQYQKAATNRLRLVRIGYLHGDRSKMDTLESYAQLKTFEILRSEASLKLMNSILDVSTYLWDQNTNPMILTDSMIPDTLSIHTIPGKVIAQDVVEKAQGKNPILNIYDLKIKSLDIEKRLKFQSLLPYLSVKANLLAPKYDFANTFSVDQIGNNYKWGFEFKMPLFLRSARGEYKKAQLKLQESQVELDYKKVEVNNKIRSYVNEVNKLQEQLILNNNLYTLYKTLLKNEEMKFFQGESTLFLINSREIKTLEVFQKQIELYSKYQKAKYAVNWAAGLLDF
jgi:outer membrane protein TolC